MAQDYTILSYEGKSPVIGQEVFIAAGARLIGDLELGDRVSVWFNTVIRADVHYIRIGADTNIQDNSVIHVTHNKYPTLIGKGVTVGHSATIHACTIEDYCLIGMGSTLLDNCHIGSESLVAAGALVTPNKQFPPRSLIAGSPAVVKRPLNDEEIAFLHYSAQHYFRLQSKYRLA